MRGSEVLLVTAGQPRRQSPFSAKGGAPPEPSACWDDREPADVAKAAPQSGGGKASAAQADALDDLFPRVEIDGLLKGTTILADAKSDAWKTKKEALEALQAILDQGANKRLKPTMGKHFTAGYSTTHSTDEIRRNRTGSQGPRHRYK